MKATIDAAGRLVIPKRLRDELGFSAGATLEMEAVGGHLEVTVPSRVRVENGPFGLRFVADTPETLRTEDVREMLERSRR